MRNITSSKRTGHDATRDPERSPRRAAWPRIPVSGRALVLVFVCFAIMAQMLAPLASNSAGTALAARDRGKEAKAIISSPGPSSAARQWRIETADGKALTPNKAFSLYNTKGGSYVKYGSRSFGINLVWSSTAPKSFIVVRQSGSGPIKYGEKVAIKVTTKGGGYLYYGSRTWGINLNWKSTPVYEWQIQGGTTGATVNNRAVVTLYNLASPRPSIPPWCGKKGAAVVYGWRPFGVNLVWNPPGFYFPGLFDAALTRLAALMMGMSHSAYLAAQKTFCALIVKSEGTQARGFATDAQPDVDPENADAATLEEAAADKRQSGDQVNAPANVDDGSQGNGKGNGKDNGKDNDRHNGKRNGKDNGKDHENHGKHAGKAKKGNHR